MRPVHERRKITVNRRFEPLQSFLSRNRISWDLLLSPEVAFNRARAPGFGTRLLNEHDHIPFSRTCVPRAINARLKDTRYGDVESPLIRISRGDVTRTPVFVYRARKLRPLHRKWRGLGCLFVAGPRSIYFKIKRSLRRRTCRGELRYSTAKWSN